MKELIKNPYIIIIVIAAILIAAVTLRLKGKRAAAARRVILPLGAGALLVTFGAGMLTPKQGIMAEYAYLYDLTDGKVVYEKASDVQTAPASTTKLLTAITALDMCDPSDIVTVGGEIALIDPDSSRAWLNQGDRLSVSDLMTAMLLPSGNDAAYTLAVFAARADSGSRTMGSREAAEYFVDKMNQKAVRLGAESSHFSSPDGFDAEGQYTTAYDMYLIGRAAYQSPVIKDICKTSRTSATWEGGRQVTYDNTNLMLDESSDFYRSEIKGLKTGRSTSAGCCLVSAFELGGHEYISVVLKTDDEGRWRDTAWLIDLVG